MTDIHFSYDDLYDLGKKVVDAAVESCRLHNYPFSQGIPTDSKYDNSGVSPQPDLGYARDLLTEVPELFASFAGPDPNGCGTSIGKVNAIRQALGDDIPTQAPDQAPPGSWRPTPAIAPNLNAVYNQALTWHGTGAEAFEDYVDNLRQPTCIVDHQGNLATVLAVGMKAHQDILNWAYQDIWSIGQETIHILDSGGTEGSFAPSGNVALQILSGVAWVAAAIATDGAAVALTALAATAGSAGGFLPQKPDTKVKGGTMLQVISSMCDVINQLITWIDNQEHLVISKLSDAATTANGWYRASTGPNGAGLFPPSPRGFADACNWSTNA